jgi:hypothetical protein
MRFPFRYALLAMSGLVLAGTARPTMAQQTITCSSDDCGRHTCPSMPAEACSRPTSAADRRASKATAGAMTGAASGWTTAAVPTSWYVDQPSIATLR